MEHRSRVVRLDDAYEDPERVWRLVTDGGPYTLMMSLAGYDMSTGDHAAMPWFRKYWAMDRQLLEPDAEPVFQSRRFLDTARDVAQTEHVVAYQMMVNLMGPMDIEPGRFAVVTDPTGAAFSVIALKADLGGG